MRCAIHGCASAARRRATDLPSTRPSLQPNSPQRSTVKNRSVPPSQRHSLLAGNAAVSATCHVPLESAPIRGVASVVSRAQPCTLPASVCRANTGDKLRSCGAELASAGLRQLHRLVRPLRRPSHISAASKSLGDASWPRSRPAVRSGHAARLALARRSPSSTLRNARHARSQRTLQLLPSARWPVAADSSWPQSVVSSSAQPPCATSLSRRPFSIASGVSC